MEEDKYEEGSYPTVIFFILIGCNVSSIKQTEPPEKQMKYKTYGVLNEKTIKSCFSEN